MSAIVDIIIPTFNNPDYLYPCVRSVKPSAMVGTSRVIVVNNGAPESVENIASPQIDVIKAKENLGWEGGLKLGLEHSDAPYVCFLNDDAFVPDGSRLWLNQMLQHFAFPDCAAVGPSSNLVMGLQNCFFPAPASVFRATFLIGFCLLVKRADLDKAGGIDDALPGGDDIDISIRLRDLGKYLLVDREAFVYHHGFKTGERVHGSDWNSIRQLEATQRALITKHGLKKWHETMAHQYVARAPSEDWSSRDTEGDKVRKWVSPGTVLELGCGPQKTVPHALGIDFVPKGQLIPGLYNRTSVADVVADVFEPLPERGADVIIARHILEHTENPIRAVKNWKESLRPGGRLIVAVPDQARNNTIPMNYQHKVGFTANSLLELMETVGFKTVSIEDAENNISMIGVFERN
jgi:GT2 family glycosyltransferase